MARNSLDLFLYGMATPKERANRMEIAIEMGERTEGWIGIPHGGVGMGIVTDLASRAVGLPLNEGYPFSGDFRLGGAGLRVGDTLHVSVSPQESGICGEAVLVGNPLPYLTATIRYGNADGVDHRFVDTCLPPRLQDLPSNLSPLPSYRKCFVCGGERNDPGLKRRFHLWPGSNPVVVALTGFDPHDRDSFYRFRRDALLHPLPFLALLDEILGWGGFMLAGSGAVTVQITFDFLRPVSVEERLVFLGRGDRKRGRVGGRLLFWASGMAGAIGENGRLEPVVYASGQFYGVTELTEQMKTSLLPQDLTQQVFTLAGDPP